MKYTEIKGDLFKAVDELEKGYMLHGCNAQGVMGSGVAKIVKEKWPYVYSAYRRWYDNSYFNPMDLGKFQVVPLRENINVEIMNAITQYKYGTDKRHVDYNGVAILFERLTRFLPTDDAVICMPKIGAGLGGGNWNIIRTIIQETCKDSKLDIRVYYID